MPDFVLDILFLAPLFLIGGFSCYTDIKYGKIKNKLIIAGLIWVIILYTFLAVYTIFYLHLWENINYIIKSLANGILAFILGYLLWYFRLWSAGDAKLFSLFAFLIPLKFYSKSYFSYFPSLNLLINLFIPLIFILTVKAIICWVKEIPGKIKQLKSKNKLFFRAQLPQLKTKTWKAIKTFLTFLAIFIVMQIIMRQMSKLLSKVIPDLTIIFISFFFLYGYIFRFVRKNKFVVPVAGGIAILYISYLIYSSQVNVLFNILKMVFIFMIIIGSLRSFLNTYIEKKEIKSIKIKDLKEGMIITEKTISEFASLSNNKNFENKFKTLPSDGLNLEQINFIKNLFSEQPEKEIKIYKTFPFSPFLMISAFITILTKDSLLAMVLRILKIF